MWFSPFYKWNHGNQVVKKIFPSYPAWGMETNSVLTLLLLSFLSDWQPPILSTSDGSVSLLQRECTPNFSPADEYSETTTSHSMKPNGTLWVCWLTSRKLGILQWRSIFYKHTFNHVVKTWLPQLKARTMPELIFFKHLFVSLRWPIALQYSLPVLNYFSH